MAIRIDLRRYLRQIAVPLIGASLLGYFGYHAIQGDRGLMAWLTLKQQLRQADAQLASLQAEQVALANRVQRMSPSTLDADLLDEQMRLMLNYARDDEVIIMLPTPAAPGAGAPAPSNSDVN
ncbi:septum formation initiator [Hypericibacter adhaerens]|jgi:cell division protein FtsB|uniref:Septum formation initiator n=1 Tax=Hypericibacter adhaerens TaxID=2602016 RepID=A0A5J6MZ61_9PROT|nr:septum formation initiator family protein [Hypericibacter adhaerens]QEX22253.1 septum formation initiator [Hypericibacter adhaerens]